ncbi:MAG TPA: PAS domain S-box protein [Bacteroidia bacterium]|nr:PAS domain S-box protein [Bacteroidia bacterium]
MKTLKDYTKYLRENHLNELALYNLEVVKGMDIPLIKLMQEKGFIKNLDDESTVKMTMDSLNRSLQAIEKGTAYADFKISLKQWEEDKVPGIKKQDITPTDLILTLAAQRKTYQHFLYDFAPDSREAIAILAELEDYQTRVQNDATEMLFNIQKKTEEQLHRTEARFKLMVQNVKDYSIFMIDTKGHVQSWNEGAQRINGYLAEEILGKHISVFLTDEDKKHNISDHNLKMAEKLGHFEGEGRRVRKDGSIYWCDFTITAIYDDKGKLEGFSKLTRDVTKQRLAAEELKAVNNFLDSVLENIPNMVFVKDAQDLRFVRFNKAGEILLGHLKQELIGKNDYDFFPKEQADFFTSKDQAVLDQVDVVDIPEEPIDTKNGQRWLHTKKIPILSPAGRPMYLLGISEDITEIRQARYDLEKKTRELERSNSELEQFAYVASHDLQEPLRTISSYVQLLESRYKDKLDKDAIEFINFAVDGSRRMRQLINSLLEYSRVNRVKPFEWVELDDIMEEIKLDMKDQFKESGATIKYNSLPKIYGDSVLIGQLFRNLIGNGIKFKGEKKPQIKISGKRKNGQFIFSVEDNGIGIPQEYYEKIFVIFQRLNNREKYPGTGIGLSICKKIVERHGGKIWVESEPGKGSSFYFTINAANGN